LENEVSLDEAGQGHLGANPLLTQAFSQGTPICRSYLKDPAAQTQEPDDPKGGLFDWHYEI
jgi:hypothetical protein